MISNVDYDFARMAVDKAKLCPDGCGGNPPPRVGVVLVKNGTLIGWCAKGVGGEFMHGGALCAFSAQAVDHAEAALLSRVNSEDARGATMFVTLEPCTAKKTGVSCDDLIVSAGISSVFVANSDPNPDVGCLAWRVFHRHNIPVWDFPSDLRNEARRDNAFFFAKFAWSKKKSGRGSFNYEENGGMRVLGDDGKQFETRWTERGMGSIYALDYENNVAVAKNCSAFVQVDDPGRWFEDSYYTKSVSQGEIVVFRNRYGYALVQILRVQIEMEGVNPELHFAYELRLF